MTSQLDIFASRSNRDDGIQRAMDHAERVEPGWKEMAYSFLVNVFLKHHKGEFQAEDVRKQCEGVVPDPPNKRAWGGIIVRAKNAGLIKSEKTRQVKNPKAHCANSAVWKRV